MPDEELDVRPLRKPQKHPTIFARFDALGVGESFVLVNNHNPIHLRDEFDRDHPDGYGWEYLQEEPREWRIRITRLASTPLPRVVSDTAAGTDETADPTGAVWSLQAADRDLDVAIHQLAADSAEEIHVGPGHDVVLHVVSGAGRVATEHEDAPVRLSPGAVVLLPKRSRRAVAAGPEGLRYLAISPRQKGLPVIS